MLIRALLIFLMLTLSGCETLDLQNLDVNSLYNAATKVADAFTVEPEEERELGKNMSAVLLGARPLAKSKRLNRYVNQVGMWLAMNSSRPYLDWRFGVLQTDAINAFAAPAGYVFVTTGMLDHLQNEAELAAVLAHEIIHVNRQHHVEAMKSGAVRGLLRNTAFAIGEGMQLDSTHPQYMEWAKKVSVAAQNLYSKGLDRDDELEADKLGIRLLAKAGYDPYAFISGLQMLESLNPSDSGLALLFKTHPRPEDRIRRVSSSLASLTDLPSANTLAKRYKRFVK